MYKPNRPEESSSWINMRDNDIERLSKEIVDLVAAQTTGLKRLREKKRIQLEKLINTVNIVKKEVKQRYSDLELKVKEKQMAIEGLDKLTSMRAVLDARIMRQRVKPLIDTQKSMLEYYGLKFFE